MENKINRADLKAGLSQNTLSSKCHHSPQYLKVDVGPFYQLDDTLKDNKEHKHKPKGCVCCEKRFVKQKR